MDINSLLSPQDTSHKTPPTSPKLTPLTSANCKARGLGSNVTPSPHTNHAAPTSSLLYNGAPYPQAPTSSPSRVNPPSAYNEHATGTPTADTRRLTQPSSTAGMDTLADLASMQQHHQQTARENAGGFQSTTYYGNTSSPANIVRSANAQSLSPRDCTGIRAQESENPQIEAYAPSVYTTNALSEGKRQIIAELDEYLKANPHAYDSHVQLIKLLHEGFTSHCHSSAETPTSPQTYTLLSHLRSARENMSGRFAMGEDLWIEWLEDQKILANSLEDLMDVIELCQKSVEQELGSTQLWLFYAEWMTTMYRVARPKDPILHDFKLSPFVIPDLSEDERIVAEATFAWQQVLDIWSQGTEATTWNLNNGNIIWDRYTELIVRQFARTRAEHLFKQIKSHFLERLGVPHMTWDQTFQDFSTFISTYDNANYEETMIHVTQVGSPAKQKYNMRDAWESQLLNEKRQKDSDAEWATFTRYIDWEWSQSRRRNDFDFNLAYALYQRAILRFPTDIELWEGLVMLVNNEFSSQSKQKTSALSILDSATQHCPWSGVLWSHYLVTAERESKPFSFLEQVKHRATSTGILDAGGLEEVIRVHTTWGGVLRRRAFQEGAGDEDLDVAEVGILSAIEDMKNLGRSTYGDKYQGDPAYRLERIYIRYLTQRHNWLAARAQWKDLAKRFGNSYEFWLRYYLWEMGTYSKLTYREGQPDIKMPKPVEATSVLQQALKRPKLDWPERILEIFKTHCEDFEDAEELQLASVTIWKTIRATKKRRELEQSQTYGGAEHGYGVQQENPNDSMGPPAPSKRKREDIEMSDDTSVKKSKPDLLQSVKVEMTEQPQAAIVTSKRDRENATIVVRNLPPRVEEVGLRKLFRDCGVINSIKMFSEDDGNSSSAYLEFESKEDVITAQTRDMRTFQDRSITVEIARQATLFVTNFPPTADEGFIRELFGKYGSILQVRFPSLKYDAHRRFCYIQFASSSEAIAATAEDGRKLDETHTLHAKISDPAKRTARTGAIYDGREIYVCNLDWNADASDLRELFDQYGEIEQIRIPVKVSGQSKGIAFIVFRTREEAKASLKEDHTIFKGRPLKVEIASDNKVKRQVTTVIQQRPRSSHSNASTPAPLQSESAANGTAPDSLAPTLSSDIASRTVALMGVPDTLNDTRVRTLAQAYGDLIKVVLRPDHQGAIVEYVDIAAAGKAMLGLNGREIAPGRKIETGTVPELLRRKAEYRTDKLGSRRMESSKKGVIVAPTVPIRRPRQTGLRRGGRGGLGLKYSGGGLSGPRAGAGMDESPRQANGAAKDVKLETVTEKPKSNADFRALLSK